jgi:hypothetical protein
MGPDCEGGICWHERYLRSGFLAEIMAQVQPITGRTPNYITPFVKFLRSAPRQYAYVYVYVPDKNALGLSAEAIVTVQTSIMRCSKRHGGRRLDNSSAVKGKACPHINEVESKNGRAWSGSYFASLLCW